MKILLDTDVVLDYILKREPFFAESNKIFLFNVHGSVEIFVSAITPVNAYYIGRKYHGSEHTAEVIHGLLKIVKICPVDINTYDIAASLEISDYEDAVQCASAMAEGLEAIVTRNVKDYKNSPIPVYSPNEFVELIAIEP